MKKTLLSAMVAVTIAFGVVSPSMVVSADPASNANEARGKYSELQEKINSLNEEVQRLDSQISPLVNNIDQNNGKISDIEKEVENKNKEIEQVKKDIEEKEKILGKRLREVYKSGGQSNYISLLFSANSLSDLIMKIDSANKLVKIDKKIVNELTESKTALNEKVSELDTKAKDLEKLNNDIKVKVKELNTKQEEQKVVVEQAKQEKETFKKEFLVPAEKELIAGAVNTIKSPTATKEEKKSAKLALEAMYGQLESEEAKAESKDAQQQYDNYIAAAERAEAERAAAEREEAERAKNQTNRGEKKIPSVTISGDAQALVNYAYNFRGLPYVWGATGPDKFDCSGFTSYVYRNAAGINIGRTTYDQINAGREVSRSELQPGDLVFPHDGHVGIYIGGGNMIHAPQTGDVIKISSVYKFWRARRILN